MRSYCLQFVKEPKKKLLKLSKIFDTFMRVKPIYIHIKKGNDVTQYLKLLLPVFSLHGKNDITQFLILCSFTK